MKNLSLLVLVSIGLLASTTIGFIVGQKTLGQIELPSIVPPPPPEKPLEKYTFANLREYPYEPATLVIEREISSDEEFTSWLVSYKSTGRTISGQMNLPSDMNTSQEEMRVIVMARGYVPKEVYATGVGTKNAAAAFARAGFITIAPDFLGYGSSDPDLSDTWEARFIKPVHLIELIQGVTEHGVPDPAASETYVPSAIGLWGHSNGGQIVLSVLQITQSAYPASVWAPVTAPFPYSILFFGDELADEGKAQRAWLAQFEQLYNVFDFSVTQHVTDLQGPLQIHHGSADDAALVSWSDAFAQKIEHENQQRVDLSKQLETAPEATQAGVSDEPRVSEPIDFSYYRYPGADHNLRPVWNTVVARDIAFFKQHLVLSNREAL